MRKSLKLGMALRFCFSLFWPFVLIVPSRVAAWIQIKVTRRPQKRTNQNQCGRQLVRVSRMANRWSQAAQAASLLPVNFAVTECGTSPIAQSKSYSWLGHTLSSWTTEKCQLLILPFYSHGLAVWLPVRNCQLTLFQGIIHRNEITPTKRSRTLRSRKSRSSQISRDRVRLVLTIKGFDTPSMVYKGHTIRDTYSPFYGLYKQGCHVIYL